MGIRLRLSFDDKALAIDQLRITATPPTLAPKTRVVPDSPWSGLSNGTSVLLLLDDAWADQEVGVQVEGLGLGQVLARGQAKTTTKRGFVDLPVTLARTSCTLGGCGSNATCQGNACVCLYLSCDRECCAPGEACRGGVCTGADAGAADTRRDAGTADRRRDLGTVDKRRDVGGGADCLCGKQDKGASCGSITYAGCCEGYVLRYCESGYLRVDNCSNGCGWDSAQSFYTCGATGSDPSGTHPRACP